MSPVFAHGRLRLYLLKLLDESPRHGYDVIRILEDRFLGVYAPSAGTVYPRLARLEEEGLVTHDREGGRKVYRLTEAGHAELEARMDELADLEQEIEHSVRDIAREVREDVRESVRGLREELKQATRDVRGETHQHGRQHGRQHDWEQAWGPARDGWWEAVAAAREAWEGERAAWREHERHDRETRQHRRRARRGGEQARGEHTEPSQDGRDAWLASGAAWRSAREEAEAAWEGPGGSSEGHRDSDAHPELAELLGQFQRSVEEAAGEGRVDEDAVRACRTILDDALTAMRAALGTRPRD